MIKVILDTNVLINGVQDEYSYTFKIIEACIAGELQTVFSPKIEKEYKLLARNLINDRDYLTLLDDFYETALVVFPKHHSDLITMDPEDNKFVDAAEESQADYIITEDHHLLDLEELDHTKIITPSEFWHSYKGSLSEDDDDDNEWQDWAKGIGI